VLRHLLVASQNNGRRILFLVVAICLGHQLQREAIAQQEVGGENQATRSVRPPRVETTNSIPSDAIVIFDGKNTDMLVGPDGAECRWPIEDGALCCDATRKARQLGLWTKQHFKDAQIHAEVYVPVTDRRGQDAGNSGLYLHGLFEMQILDSYQNRVDPIHSMGAIYSINPPLVNATRPPGSWQTYDIIYRAPKRDEKGEPIAAGSVTALLNGVLVQDHAPILRHVSVYAPLYAQRTAYSRSIRESVLKTGAGPLWLQDHDSPVKFRNIWIRPLDENASVFSP
jgi:hypothetical protein